jgi:DNA-binding PadR family transcriptional regulator
MREPALKTPSYYILLALATGDLHGQAIAREVLAVSDGRVRLWPARLYGALEDLSDRGWIEELHARTGRPDESERRRYYRITRAGRAAAAAEPQRLAELVRVARSRIKPRTGESS